VLGNVALDPYILKRRSSTLTVDAIDWPMALWLAALYGWDEIATSPPQSMWSTDPLTGEDDLDQALDRWGRSWLARQGQGVWFEESTSLAEVLASTLLDIPPHCAASDDLDLVAVRRDAILRTGPVGPLEWFGGDRRYRLLELIEFCHGHVFEIW
jgi:hypothetical protein